MYPREKNQLLN